MAETEIKLYQYGEQQTRMGAGVCDSLLNGKHHTASSTLAPLEVDKATKNKAAGRRRCLDLFNPLPGVACSAELCGIGLSECCTVSVLSIQAPPDGFKLHHSMRLLQIECCTVYVLLIQAPLDGFKLHHSIRLLKFLQRT